MLRVFFSLLLTCLFATAYAQEDEYILFDMDWEVGKTYQFKVSKSEKEFMKSGRVLRNDSTTFTATLKVVSKDENGNYALSWEYDLDPVDTYNIPESFKA